MQDLLQVKERVQAYSQVLSQKLLAELTAHLQVAETQYQDVLVECALSGTLQWLRFQQRRGSAVHGDQTLLGSEFALGSSVLITNLKPGRAPLSGGALNVLLACDSSTVRNLGAVPAVTPAKDPLLPSGGAMCSPQLDSTKAPNIARASLQVLQPSGTHHASSLRCFSVTRSPKESLLSGQEATFAMLIVAWHVQESPEHSSVSELKVFGVDRERMGVLLTYPLPTDLLGKLPWLAAGQVVTVDCAQLEHFDTPKDIVQVRRGERTVVSAAMSNVQQEALSCRSAMSASFSAVKNKPPVGGYAASGVKRKAFAPPVVTPGTVDAKRSRMHFAPPSALKPVSSLDASTAVCAAPKYSEGGPDARVEERATVTEAVESEFSGFEKLAWLAEDEKRRYGALLDCARSFAPSLHPHYMEGCDREVLARATVKLDSPSPSAVREGEAGAETEANVLIFDEESFSDRVAVIDVNLLAILKTSCGFCDAQQQQMSGLCVVLARCTRTAGTEDAASDTGTHSKAEFWKMVWMAPAPNLTV